MRRMRYSIMPAPPRGRARRRRPAAAAA
eukprot:COSAG01_NODE_74419_length_214_cov_4.504348_1_plen_27_part_10